MRSDPSLDQELVPLNEAHNRILARPLSSRVDDPPFDNSAMDGWALRYEDTNDASERTPAPLRIIGESRAAHEPNLPSVTSGTAVRIMTGAQVPPEPMPSFPSNTRGSRVMRSMSSHRVAQDSSAEGQRILRSGRLVSSRVPGSPPLALDCVPPWAMQRYLSYDGFE